MKLRAFILFLFYSNFIFIFTFVFILSFRASWDPKLIPKEIIHLEQTMTMFNLVHVCLFCAQFFNPNCADGISFPAKIVIKVSFVPLKRSLIFFMCFFFFLLFNEFKLLFKNYKLD